MSLVPSSFAGRARRLSPADALVAALAPFLALELRGVDWSLEAAYALGLYCALGAAFSIIFLVQFRIGQIIPRYLSRRDVTQILKMSALAAAFCSVAAFSVGRLDLIPRSVPLIHFAVLAAFLTGWRALFGAFERRQQAAAQSGRRALSVPILIVGVGPAASLFIRLLKTMSEARPHIVGLLDDDVRLHGRSIDGHVILGGADRFEAVVMELASHGVRLQRVLIAHSDADAQKAARATLEDACARHGVQLEAMADRLGLPSFDSETDERVSSSYVVSKTRAQRYLMFRRYVDAALAAAGLIVLAPVIALVALAIRLRLGAPVVFWQQRVGMHGEQVVVHKFRTFKPAVDEVGRLLPEDERASRLGRFLRAVRLDELPQLYDVLRGRMNLIGPRPLLPVDLAQDCSVRLSVAPGLTGWAQVHGGKEISAEEKNALDEWYVYHASLGVDLRIVWATLRMIVCGDRRADDAIEQAVAFRTQRLSEEEARIPAAAGKKTPQIAANYHPAPAARSGDARRPISFPRAANTVAADVRSRAKHQPRSLSTEL
jgi:lipopolysaccharide/colanic/teichoic acid biosynthesis glycosyltransferase